MIGSLAWVELIGILSEKLKNTIEENNFTGVEFVEVSELDNIEVIY